MALDTMALKEYEYYQQMVFRQSYIIQDFSSGPGCSIVG